MVRQVQPLRISKTTPSSSPSKMPVATSRPLSEIGSTERRRNSPSYNQATKKAIVSREGSPYTENSSPQSYLKSSPRDFWSIKDPMSPSRFDTENSPQPDASPTLSSPKRRPSVERLMQASRVKNSNIFALESRDSYDPSTLPVVERPSANRPLSNSLANNSFTRLDSIKKENNPLRSPGKSGHKRAESQTELPLLTPTKSAAAVPLPTSPDKQSSPSSPTKSSLARSSQFGIPALDSLGLDNTDIERIPTPRQAKSVTFHQDPPVVNEYEEQTPEPSLSVASDREGSWDSEEFYDEDVSFERGSSLEPDRDDSFDADLENADKTPVVLPEDWSRMSPDGARNDLADAEDDVFDEGEPTERGLPTRVASDGEARPLPPLPAFMQRERSGSGSLASTAERAAQAARGSGFTPQRATCSKDEILQMMSKSSTTKLERIELLTETAASKSVVVENEEALTVTNLDTGEKVEVEVKEKEIEEDSVVGDLSEFTKSPPRISRESILRSVRNSKYDFEDFEGENDVDESEFLPHGGDLNTRPSIAELAKMDPDQPIPSRENSRETSDTYRAAPVMTDPADEFEEIKIKDEPTDEDGFDMNSIPASIEEQKEPTRSPSRLDDYDRQSSVLHNGRAVVNEEEEEDDSSSRYSSVEPDAESSTLNVRQSIEQHEDGKETLQEAMQLLTVKDYSSSDTLKEPTKQGTSRITGDFVGLPAYLSTDDDYDFGMKDFITPSPPSAETREKTVEAPKMMPQLQPPLELSRDIPIAPSAPYVERQVSPPGTPNSVIRHDDGVVSPLEDQKSFIDDRPKQLEVPVSDVPERVASIKTPGGKLKARPSSTPADLLAMAEQRRMVSSEQPPVPPLPAVTEDTTTGATNETSRPTSSSTGERPKSPQKDRRKSRKSGGRMDLSFLDASTLSIGDDEEGLGLDEDFDRVIEAQKVSTAPFPPPLFARFDATSQQRHSQPADNLPASRQVCVSYDSNISPYKPHSSSAGANVSTRTQKGYLMRQNTKVVVASNRNVSGESNETAKSSSTTTTTKGEDESRPMSPAASETMRPSSRQTKSANSSPRKGSEEQFMKTEPWNGKIRRKSVRVASIEMEARKSEVAPPLPGQESALGVVHEDYAAGSSSLVEEVGDGVERGRLFVKVVGVKDLDMPLPRNDRIDFQLTLDNGLHCVTTTSLELGTTAPIGQEFELVVLNDLEFQLTLTTKLPPPPQPTPPSSSGSMSSPTKSPAKNQKGAFSRFLSSPKKRAEKERQEREAAAAEERRLQEEAMKRRQSQAPSAWDLMRELVNAQDGSFARAYINLNAHEKQCFGRQLTVDVPCYNEWALEKDAQVVNSVRSKRGTNGGPVRRPPYVIGQLQLSLFYVPKPKTATDEDMPKSMSAAMREMKRADEVTDTVHEGHLSQQGGDCTHWRRRFFRLQGTRLTAYHEHTHQKRAVINLSKASRLVDDKRMLTADRSPTKSKGGRRKSAFAEEDEAYQYVEEGFRMRFANGETIDFYAESKARKDEWMVALSQVIGKPDTSQKAATWTDMVLARERAEGRPLSAGSSTSPVKTGASEVKDFGRPAVGPRGKSKDAGLPTKSAMTSKSAPSSPVKGSAVRNPPLPTAAATAKERPKTPPMSPRKGHRSRNAVKSMIF